MSKDYPCSLARVLFWAYNLAVERKAPFIQGEQYHLYSRGVEKRKIFLKPRDYERFIALLYIMNQAESFRMDNFLRAHEQKYTEIFNEKREKTLVSILAYCLMPNHFHLVVMEHSEGGISRFMSKLLTAYSMYFNTKYDRSGPLLTHPFRSEHIHEEAQYMYIFSYVHLNPLSIIEPAWKEEGIREVQQAEKFLKKYFYSSYLDFLGTLRPEAKIIDFSSIPLYIKSQELDFRTYRQSFDQNRLEQG